MKKRIKRGLATLIVSGMVCNMCGANITNYSNMGNKVYASSADVTLNFDWAEYMSRNDMVWEVLPDNWENGAFSGNGFLGDMIFHSPDKKTIDFEISRTDVYDHRINKKEAKDGQTGYGILFSGARLPNGHFELGYMGDAVKSGTMRLGLYDALITSEIETDKGTLSLSTYTHANEDVIVVDINTTGDEAEYTWEWKPDISMTSRGKNPPADYIAYPEQKHEVMNGVDVSVQEMPEDEIYYTNGKGAGQYATAWLKVKNNDGSETIYISEKFSYPGVTAKEDAVQAVLDAAEQGKEVLFQAHKEWWHSFYQKSFLSVPDSRIESFYWSQLYKMASATRVDAPHIDLMGPFYKPGSSWPAYWWNLNEQLIYWLSNTSNHNDLSFPMINAMYDNIDILELMTGKEGEYEIGTVLGPNMLSDGYSLGNLAYALNNAWQTYRYTMDEELLREKVYPLMLGNYKFMKNNLFMGEDEKWHMSLSASPEYTHTFPDGTKVSSYIDTNYTLSLFKWLAESTLEAAEILDDNDNPMVKDIKNLLTNLAEYPIDEETGFLIGKEGIKNSDGSYSIGRDVPLGSSHRHWSHLFMIYPLKEYTYDNPETKELFEQSVKHFVEIGNASAFAGYSWGAMIAFNAMASRGNEALYYLNRFFTDVDQDVTDSSYRGALDNTLYRESSPVIETPLFVARTINEMLLLSMDDIFKVFPAIPDDWKDVTFDKLLAEGAFEVSAKREDGKTQFIKIKSLAGEPCKVITDLEGEIKAYGEREFTISSAENGAISVDLEEGESVILYTGELPENFEITPVETMDTHNYFGTKSQDTQEEAAIMNTINSLSIPEIITEDLNLPTEGEEGVKIQWLSNDTTVVDNRGRVYLPKTTEERKNVILTATVMSDNWRDTKHFSAEVWKLAPFIAYASDDTRVRPDGSNKTKNYGAASSLFSYTGDNGDESKSQIYLKFDISGVLSNPDVIIEKAEFVATPHFRNPQDNQPFAVEYVENDNWTEGSGNDSGTTSVKNTDLTFERAEGMTSIPIAEYLNRAPFNEPLAIDVTKVLDLDDNGKITLKVISIADNRYGIQLYSKEAKDMLASDKTVIGEVTDKYKPQLRLTLNDDPNKVAVYKDAEALELGDLSNLNADIVIPKKGSVKGSQITWVSSDPSVLEIVEQGENYIAKYNEPSDVKQVKLIATITSNQLEYEEQSVNKEFEVVVIPSSTSLEPGDMNGDNKITAIDALYVLKHMDVLSANVADVNGDGEVDIKDALKILQVASGEIDS